MANLFGSIQELLSSGQLGDAQKLANQAATNVGNVKTPDLASLIPQLTKQVQAGTMTAAQMQAALQQVQGQFTPAQWSAALTQVQGTMTPAQQQVAKQAVQGVMEAAQASATLQGDSGMKNVTTDAGTAAGARQALLGLSDIANKGGLTDADRAQLDAIQNQNQASASQNIQGQLQQLQQQGNRGSGADLAARLSGQQSAANANAAAGANIAGTALSRQLQALQGGVSGNTALNAQLFGQDAAKAAAQDAVNQYNSGIQNTIAIQNAAARQQANQTNLTTAQQVAAANQAAQNAAYANNATNAQAANQLNYTTANQIASQNTAATNAASAANATAQQQATAAQYAMQNQVAANNAANQQAANAANQAASQQANAINFNTANTIGAKNTDIANQNALLPYQAAQQQYQNSLGQAVANSQTQLGAANSLANQGNITLGNTVGGLAALTNNSNAVGNAIGGAAGAVGGALGSIGKGAGDAIGNWLSGLGGSSTGSGSSLGTDWMSQLFPNTSAGGADNLTTVPGQTDWLSQLFQPGKTTDSVVKDDGYNYLTPTKTPTTTTKPDSVVQSGGTDWMDQIMKGVGSSAVGAVGNAAGSAAGSWLGDLAGGLGSTLSDWGSSLFDFFSDEDLKEDKGEMSDEEIDQLFANLSGHKFRYKGDPRNRDQVGIMAQDLEKVSPDSVIDTPAGKMVQGESALNMALAAMSNMHGRLKDLEDKKGK